MNYKIIEQELRGETLSSVVIAREDGSFESFPVDESNPRYIQFLEETA